MTTVFENIYHRLGNELGGLLSALNIWDCLGLILGFSRCVIVRISNHCCRCWLEGRQRYKTHLRWPRDEIYPMAPVSVISCRTHGFKKCIDTPRRLKRGAKLPAAVYLQ